MDEGERLYKKLADAMTNSSERANLTADDIHKVKVAICNVEQVEDLLDNMDIIYHILRYLRNACIECKKNQNIIVDALLLKNIVQLMEFIFNPALETLCKNKENISKNKLVAVQFLGNLVVQNIDAKTHVWNCCFPSLFFKMMSNLDGKGKDYVCMVIYNCLRERCNLVESKEECWLLNSIIDHCNNYEDVEWGLLVMELVVCSQNFIVLYNELVDYPDMRTSLLDITNGYLSDDGSEVKIPEDNLIFLVNQFETKSACMMMLAKEATDEVLQECRLLFKILSLLSISTGFVQYNNLRQNEKLLKVTIQVLKQICASTEPDISDSVNPTDHHPMFDFKRNLIKIIGNMCYKNKIMQEKVREFDGIVPVLNCCSVDDRNPYIMQWAIFAIRNICEVNSENQSFIAGLENHGVANNVLADSNVNAKMENGKIKISTNAQQN